MSQIIVREWNRRLTTYCLLTRHGTLPRTSVHQEQPPHSYVLRCRRLGNKSAHFRKRERSLLETLVV